MAKKSRRLLAIIVIATALAVGVCPGLAFGSYAGQGPDDRAALESAAHGQGLHVFSGTMNVHHEEWPDYMRRPEGIDVASVSLDNPLEYTSYYKGEFRDTAYEISVGSIASLDGDYAYWSAMDGKHVTVCCSSLHEAYHDGSYYNVDAFASPDVRLLYNDDAAGPEMCRLYNPYSGEHFYTANFTECAGLMRAGWQHEGIGWTAPEKSDTPVYRMYNPYAGEHHYTMDASEKDSMIAAGWKDEGVGWYSDGAKTTPLYREYNPNEPANNHNYTTSKVEHDKLVSLGWRDEGYAWYGV